jgi:protein tyrosine/serine phosphatase|tara:strand:+ start:326 stop:544 length:219 start_codon:yes stop_codon:yes gene_type:complete
MDADNQTFKLFLNKVTKLENIIKNRMDEREFNTILYNKFNISIENIDAEYNKLLVRKVTENLIHENILNLIN